MAGIQMGLLQPAVPPPRCVRFCPSERELIEVFLQPKVAGFVDPQCLMQTLPDILHMHPETIQHNAQVYFPHGQYYYFATRVLMAGNGVNRPNREIANTTDRWRYFSTKRIFNGLLLIGHVETLELKTALGLRTGYTVKEYRLAHANNVFQTQAIVHLERDAARDERVVIVEDGHLFDLADL